LNKILEAQEEVQGKGKARGKRRSKAISLRLSDVDTAYLSVLHYSSRHVSSLVSRLSYIGPVREHPQRFYESKEEIPANVGLRGEDTPQVLFLRKDKQFHINVNTWLKDLGLTHKTWCPKLHEDIFAVMTRDPITRAEVNFADTGFGLSQLLPLVVQSFHSPPKSMMFLEQPEIHLNPKLQCHLANLFAAVAGSGKTMVVEKHSEHLVLRLRTLIAEGKLDSEDIALYYVEKLGGRSTVRRISIEKDGFIKSDQWPQGFFEESLIEALRLARPVESVK
jgi:predicted ATPase